MKGVKMPLTPPVEIICEIDDFCKDYERNKQEKVLGVDGIKNQGKIVSIDGAHQFRRILRECF